MAYHRNLRGKNATLSVLDTVPGIGPRRRKELIKFFGERGPAQGGECARHRGGAGYE